jgi:hypothetical protein
MFEGVTIFANKTSSKKIRLFFLNKIIVILPEWKKVKCLVSYWRGRGFFPVRAAVIWRNRIL